jgi:hypothetical protein
VRWVGWAGRKHHRGPKITASGESVCNAPAPKDRKRKNKKRERELDTNFFWESGREKEKWY